MSDDELTLQVPLVVEARVAAVDVPRLSEDRLLPPGWQDDPEKRWMVESGSRWIKWSLEVNRWIKGTSAASILGVRAVMEDGTFASGSGIGEGIDVVLGKRYVFWLEPHTWFQQEHHVVVRAREV